MPQIINTNIASLNAQRNLNKSQAANQTALQRLSSGLRINSAKDDAAGLAISTRFNSQIRGLNVAVRNAGDGISLAQTAEGALGSMNDNLQRIRELAVQSANATNSDVDREALQSEVSQLLAEVSRTADETDFNGRKLLDGSFNATFQIGANAGQTLQVSISELTADKLGSASTAGISATGSANALSNGDLIINNVSIEASTAGDDTASTDNAGASAIAKVAAINRQTDETGVTASVNDNVVSGAEMTGVALSGTITLNGVDVAISSTTSTSGTRAAVEEAINAVSDQTGITAINTGADKGGVQLVAEDGRNIQISFTTLTSAGTGLATAGTYEGGYTLVADAATGTVEIGGGNGTGNGDLANAGLTAGTYDRGVAASVSDVQRNTLDQTNVTGGSLANISGDADDDGTLVTGGSLTNTLTTTALAASATANFYNVTVGITTAAATITTNITFASAQAVYQMATAITTMTGGDVQAFEQIDFLITDYNSVTGGGNIFLAGQALSIGDDLLADFDTTTERLRELTDVINSTTFAANITVVAELSFAGDEISVSIQNATGDVMRLGVATNPNGAVTLTATGSGGAFAVSNGLTLGTSGAALIGGLGFKVGANVDSATLSLVEGTAALDTGELFTAGTGTFDASSFTDKNNGSTSTNEVTLNIDNLAVGSTTLAAGSSVAELATAVSGLSTDVNAWEEISLLVVGSNLEIGDELIFSSDINADGDYEADGVTISISGTSLAQIVENINTTDFSDQAMDVSAELNAAGTNFTINIRNYSGDEVHAFTTSDSGGRALQISGASTPTDLIGSREQSLSGVLTFSSESGSEIDLTIADPSVGGEYYANNSVASNYAGVNGLSDGDLLLNGVSIGAADTDADRASAEFASDSTKILSSSKELSAIAVAASINAVADETGVSAEINATQVVGGDGTNNTTALQAQFDIGDAAEIFINGYSAGTITLQDDGSGNIDTDRAKSDALDVINSISGQTGVVAEDNGVSLSMSASDGRNISVAIDDQAGADASIGALFGLDAAVNGIGESTFGDTPATTAGGISAESATYQTTYGTVTLSSAGEFTVAAGAEGADELEALGLTEGSYGGSSDGQFLTEIDISTFDGATAALTAIDNAIGEIAAQRAVLGAIQNRMESTVSNLAITSENLSAANSRIQDADFAAETAELSRTQVLQQAGISILAQANQGPQQVLSLLG